MPKITPSTPKRIYDAMTYSISPIKYILRALQPAADTLPTSNPSSSSPGGSSPTSTRTQAQQRRRPIPTKRREVQRQNSIRKERSFRINERPNHSILSVDKLGKATAAAIADNISSLDPSHNIIAEQLNKMFQARNTISEQLACSSLADICEPSTSSNIPHVPNLHPSRTPTAAPAPYPLQPRTMAMPRRGGRHQQTDRERKQEEAAKAFALKKVQELERKRLEADLATFRTKYHQHAEDAERGLADGQQFVNSLNQDLRRARSLHTALKHPNPHQFHHFSRDTRMNVLYDAAVTSYHSAVKAGSAFISAQESLINVAQRRLASWSYLRSTLSSLYASFHSSVADKEGILALFKEARQRQQECFDMKPLTGSQENVALLAQTFETAFELAQLKQDAYEGEMLRVMEEQRSAEKERALEEELRAAKAQEERRRCEAEAYRALEEERKMARQWAAERERAEAIFHIEAAARRVAEAQRFAEQQAAYRFQAELEKERILKEARSHFAGYQDRQHYPSAGPIPVDDVSMRTVVDEPEPEPQYNFNDVSMADCTAPLPSYAQHSHPEPSPPQPPPPTQEAPHAQPSPHYETPRSQPSPQAPPRAPPAPAQEIPRAATSRPQFATYPASLSGRPNNQQRVAHHDARWKVLRGSGDIEPISFRQMPWPVLSEATCARDLTSEAFEAFYKAAASSKSRSRARVIKEALLRFHPDKFAQVEAKIQIGALDEVRLGMALVIHYLNAIKNEE